MFGTNMQWTDASKESLKTSKYMHYAITLPTNTNKLFLNTIELSLSRTFGENGLVA